MLSLVALSCALAHQANPAVQPVDRFSETWWKERHEAAKAITGPLDVAFLGDSITQGWEGVPEIWRREFGHLKTGNYGYSGDRTEHVLWRLQNGELIEAKPKVVVLMIGTNNIGHRSTNPAQAVEGVRSIVQLLRRKLPESKLLLLGVFPRGEAANDPMRLEVADLTNRFRRLGDGKAIHFLDLAPHFVRPDGTLRVDLMPDRLHLNPLGYDLWARAIREPLVALLGQPRENLRTGRWISLFDGKTLDGWKVQGGKATYKVEDGTIVGQTAEGSPNTFLCSDRTFKDFELEFETKVHDKLNSGVQIRSRAGGNHAEGTVSGPQVEIESSPGQAAYVYGEATRFGWLSKEPQESSESLNQHSVFRNGEWNRYRVVAQGPRIRVWLHGVPVGDVTHPEIFESHPEGFVGLQVHSIGRGEGPYSVAWRQIRIRELR